MIPKVIFATGTSDKGRLVCIIQQLDPRLVPKDRETSREGALTLGLPTEILHLGSARLHLTVDLGI